MGAVLIEGSPAPPLYAHAHKATGDVGFPRRCANKVVRKSHSTVPSFLPPVLSRGPGQDRGANFIRFGGMQIFRLTLVFRYSQAYRLGGFKILEIDKK